MKINKHVQKLDYPEYTDLSFETAKIDLSRHGCKDEKYNYLLSQDKELISSISKIENLNAENVLITAGADAALHHIAETFLDEGKIAVIPVPAFGRFEFHTKVVGAKVIFIEHAEFPYSFDLEIITGLAKKNKADVVFIANPNNPTGELISKKRLKKFIRDNKDSLVVIDEVLIGDQRDSVGKFVNSFKNLVVIKSFSKLFGIPGLRVGYILTNTSLLKMIVKTVSPYEVSSLSLRFIKKVLAKRKPLKEIKKESRITRIFLRRKSPLPLTNIQASVGLIDAGNHNVPLFDYLLKHGILTVEGKNFRGLENTNTVRVIINSKKNIVKLITILQKYKDDSL